MTSRSFLSIYSATLKKSLSKSFETVIRVNTSWQKESTLSLFGFFFLQNQIHVYQSIDLSSFLFHHTPERH